MAKQTFTTGQVLTAAEMTSLQQTAMGGGSTTAKTASYVLVAADAGTVVQMNSASATTITVNTALFAAGDTVQIQNVGAGVCTVTAGTATVSTSATLALKQYDAGSLYFNTTSAAIFFAVDAADGMANPLTTTGDMVYSSSGSTPARLGIGSSAQVLSVSGGIPAWTTASASALTLISATAFTTSTAVTISNCFTSTYTNYRMLLQITAATGDNVDIRLQYRASATTATTNYKTQRIYGFTSTVGTDLDNQGNSSNICGGVDKDFPSFSSSSVDIFQPQVAAPTLYNAQTLAYNPNMLFTSYAGGQSDSTQFDSAVLTPTAGNITGTVYFYGYQKS